MSEVVMFDGESAKPFSVRLDDGRVANVWISRHGSVWPDERAARFDGCTHVSCSGCGEPVAKMWLSCERCQDARNESRWAAMPEAQWDGKSMVYSEALDKYFASPCEAAEGATLDGVEGPLRLIQCEPVYASGLGSHHWEFELPDEAEGLPDELQALVDEFNRKLEAKPILLSWTPGKHRLPEPK